MPRRCNSCASSPASTRRRRPMPRPSTARCPKSPTAPGGCWLRCIPMRRRATARSRPRRRGSARGRGSGRDSCSHDAESGTAYTGSHCESSSETCHETDDPAETERHRASPLLWSGWMLWWSGSYRCSRNIIILAACGAIARLSPGTASCAGRSGRMRSAAADGIEPCAQISKSAAVQRDVQALSSDWACSMLFTRSRATVWLRWPGRPLHPGRRLARAALRPVRRRGVADIDLVAAGACQPPSDRAVSIAMS